MTFAFCLALAVAQTDGAKKPAPSATKATPKPAAAPFAKEIAALEAKLKAKPPGPNAVFFYGSSSIRLWKLEKSFPELETVNLGFGGSTYASCAQYVERVFTGQHPKTVVLYAGDNDLAERRTVERVEGDLRAVLRTIEGLSSPPPAIVVLAVKHSNKRLALKDTQARLNDRLRALAKEKPNRRFVDGAAPLLDDGGRPKKDYFMPDELHLSAAGYAVWTAKLRASGAPFALPTKP